MAKKEKITLLIFLIFVVGLVLRFVYFSESIYFGYDEARDAFRSQEIYRNGDLKLLGPVANYPGIHHGPLFWYLIGPLYLLSGGNVSFVSAVFRILNALAVFFVYLIGKKYFDRTTGIIAAVIFIFSFEQNQYAMYVGNPSLAVFAWIGLFYGAALILKDKNYKGLILMFASAALATQFEFILSYTFAVMAIVLLLLRKEVARIEKKYWFWAMFFSLVILSNYIVAEIKFDFQTTKALLNLIKSGYDVMQPGDTRFTLYLKMFLRLFRDNVFAFQDNFFLFLLASVVTGWLFYQLKYSKSVALILIWIFSALLLLPFGGYDAYYVNVGVGLGIIIGSSFMLREIIRRRKVLGIFLIGIIILSNLSQILKHNKGGLILEIKAQPGMRLTDEIKVIEEMYFYADGRGFTLRATTMPYKIQTVWAYLFNSYTQKRWGYLPFWETGLVEGFPGVLPTPRKGTTCVRFLLKEPTRGIPEHLIINDEAEENWFSFIKEEKKFGEFNLQIRQARGECHNERPN